MKDQKLFTLQTKYVVDVGLKWGLVLLEHRQNLSKIHITRNFVEFIVLEMK